MISPAEIKAKAERKYAGYLQSVVQEVNFFPLVIIGDKTPSKTLPELQKEIVALVNESKEKKGYGFVIDYETRKTKTIGTQTLPTSIYFESEKDFLKYLSKEKELRNFTRNYRQLLAFLPELRDWVIKNPLKVVQYDMQWEGIINICNYFKSNPKPDLYTRELPVNVHTKFVENNQSIIRELLDIIIEPHINPEEKHFERRFNLKYSEPLVRFKILDTKISDALFSGLDDLAVPVSQFQNLNMPVKRVIIVENKTSLYTLLTLPPMPDTIAIFGSGYGAATLKNINWMQHVDLLYWGDMDTHGFEILSQVRGYFPHIKSFLMDKVTFDRFFENDSGTPSNISAELNLNNDELQLYNVLKMNNWRLEQEKIPLKYVNEVFDNYLSASI